MKLLKIVIIAKNCYPALGPRAHRTTELAKELARRGHQVKVYALLGNYDYSKISKETGIIFNNLGVSKLGVKDNTGKYSKKLLASAGRKIFGKFLQIPNVELMPMVKRALYKEEQIEYLITIAYPHTIHWGAASYVKKNKNKIAFWVADCGDPFMMDPYNYRPFYFSYFEKSWGRLCDFITVPIESAKSGYYPEFRDKIRVIPQGFRFDEVELASYKKNEVPTFAFSGMVYRGLRDPAKFLKYLTTLDKDFRFVVYTKQHHFYKEYVEKLGEKLELRDYVPRAELLKQLSSMDFLINIKNVSEVQQPSKLIDYALTKRPILEISSDFDEERHIFNEFLEKNYSGQFLLENLEVYDIKNVSNKFIKLYKK